MRTISTVGLALAVTLAGGCSKTDTATPAKEAVHHHEHHPPHGGAPVELGQEANHVEIVVDPVHGKMQGYVLDGELENFVRIAAPSLEIQAKVAGHDETLTQEAVANNATGEKVGDTSLFEAQADWLKTTPQFDAVLKEIRVNGTTHTNIAFNYPKGSDEGAKK